MSIGKSSKEVHQKSPSSPLYDELTDQLQESGAFTEAGLTASLEMHEKLMPVSQSSPELCRGAVKRSKNSGSRATPFQNQFD